VSEAAVSMLRPSTRRHVDGSTCTEGTRRLPPGFEPCCAEFAQHTAACVFDVRYEWWASAKAWFIALSDMAGGGGVQIRHCPHCGTDLKTLAK